MRAVCAPSWTWPSRKISLSSPGWDGANAIDLTVLGGCGREARWLGCMRGWLCEPGHACSPASQVHRPRLQDPVALHQVQPLVVGHGGVDVGRQHPDLVAHLG
jgi:hypothetical protein